MGAGLEVIYSVVSSAYFPKNVYSPNFFGIYFSSFLISDYFNSACWIFFGGSMLVTGFDSSYLFNQDVSSFLGAVDVTTSDFDTSLLYNQDVSTFFGANDWEGVGFVSSLGLDGSGLIFALIGAGLDSTLVSALGDSFFIQLAVFEDWTGVGFNFGNAGLVSSSF